MHNPPNGRSAALAKRRLAADRRAAATTNGPLARAVRKRRGRRDVAMDQLTLTAVHTRASALYSAE
ncbi:hypothetical protein, partial [Lysobacter enzymogenes]|uniref:hypothetical protein n=1 Tax=Lysobacter enzymogenes TaxID=69 RepID=UPI0019D113C5